MTLSVLVRIQPPLFIPYEYIFAGIAQLVEQRTENPCVPSSNLGPSTPYLLLFAGNLELVAQWTRACGYELQCRGFESLLARFTFPRAKPPPQALCSYFEGRPCLAPTGPGAGHEGWRGLLGEIRGFMQVRPEILEFITCVPKEHKVPRTRKALTLSSEGRERNQGRAPN